MVWPFTSTALLPAGLILRGGCISSPVLHVVLAVQQRPAATPSTAPPEGDTVSSRTEHVAVPLEPGGQIGEEEEFPHKVLEVDDEAASPSRNTITSWGAAEFSYFGGTADRYSESRNYELSNAQVYRRERSKKYSSLRLPALNRPADHSVRQERAHQGAGRTNGKQHHYRPRAAQEDVKMRPHRGSTRAATRPSTQHVRTARKREIGETRTAGAASSSADALLELNAGATGGFEIDEAALDHVDEQQMANDVEIILERELARTGPVPKPYSKRRLAAALVQKSMEEADARAWFATWHYTVKFDRPNVDHGGGVRHVAKLLRDAEFVRELNEFLQHGGTQLQKNTLQPTIIETEAIEKEERCEKDIKAEAAKAYDFAQLDPLPLGLQQAVIVMCGLTMLMVLFVLITSDLPPVAPVPPELERTFDAALAEQKAALVGEAKADAKVKAIAIKKGAMIDLTKVPKAKARAEGEAVAEAPVPRELADVGKRQQAQIGPGGSSMFGGVQSSAGASSAFGAGGSMASSSAMGSSAMAGSSALGGSAGFGAGSKSGAFGAGSAAFGAGSKSGAFEGGGSSAFGGGSASFGAGSKSGAFGGGSSAMGGGSASFGAGSKSSAFGGGSSAMGGGSASFGAGSASFGAGSMAAAKSGFGGGSASFGGGSAAMGGGSASFGGGSAVMGKSAAPGGGSAAFGGGSIAAGSIGMGAKSGALGGGSMAGGSMAMGGGSAALGGGSMAAGSMALGAKSGALGGGSMAIGGGSISMSPGGKSGALGGGSMAIGGGSMSPGGKSGALGGGSMAIGGGSMAIGAGSMSPGGKSGALGGSMQIGGGSMAIGGSMAGAKSGALGGGSMAMGGGSMAIGGGSMSPGGKSGALGGGSMAMGSSMSPLAKASGALGGGSMAMGSSMAPSAKASGALGGSMAMGGGGSMAMGAGSLAMGGKSGALGGSMAMGGSMAIGGGSMSIDSKAKPKQPPK